MLTAKYLSYLKWRSLAHVALYQFTTGTAVIGDEIIAFDWPSTAPRLLVPEGRGYRFTTDSHQYSPSASLAVVNGSVGAWNRRRLNFPN